MVLFWFLIPIVIYLFYKWFTANANFFEKNGIPSMSFYDTWSVLFIKQPMVKSFMDNYIKFENEKYVSVDSIGGFF